MLNEPAPIVEGKQVTAFAAVAALMWMTWDMLIHLSVEVECIWQRPRSWTKWAYFFIRYIPIVHGGAILTLAGNNTFPASGCRGWIIEQLVVIEVLTLIVETVLVMRLYVMYNQNKVILSTILIAFFAEVVVMITALSLTIPKQTFTPDCLVASAPRIFMMYWLSSLTFETFLFVLTLVKFFENAKAVYGRESVIYIFIRDGIWAFAVIFLAFLLNTITYQLHNTPVAGMGYFWALSVLSFAGSHVLLNLRRFVLEPQGETVAEVSAFHATVPHLTSADTFSTGSHSVLAMPAVVFRSGPSSADDLNRDKDKPGNVEVIVEEDRGKPDEV